MTGVFENFPLPWRAEGDTVVSSNGSDVASVSMSATFCPVAQSIADAVNETARLRDRVRRLEGRLLVRDKRIQDLEEAIDGVTSIQGLDAFVRSELNEVMERQIPSSYAGTVGAIIGSLVRMAGRGYDIHEYCISADEYSRLEFELDGTCVYPFVVGPHADNPRAITLQGPHGPVLITRDP